ncbi:MAG: hypothetical protein ACYC9Y_07190 [Candidatus Methylomirabilia bacterium]
MNWKRMFPVLMVAVALTLATSRSVFAETTGSSMRCTHSTLPG